MKSLLFGTKCVFKHQDFQCLKLKQISVIFHPIEVVDRGGETQLQVGENLNKLTWRFRVKIFYLKLNKYE